MIVMIVIVKCQPCIYDPKLTVTHLGLLCAPPPADLLNDHRYFYGIRVHDIAKRKRQTISWTAAYRVYCLPYRVCVSSLPLLLKKRDSRLCRHKPESVVTCFMESDELSGNTFRLKSTSIYQTFQLHPALASEPLLLPGERVEFNLVDCLVVIIPDVDWKCRLEVKPKDWNIYIWISGSGSLYIIHCNNGLQSLDSMNGE